MASPSAMRARKHPKIAGSVPWFCSPERVLVNHRLEDEVPSGTGEVHVGGDDPACWAALAVHVIPYGGLLAGRLAAGETLLVSGATGNLGSSAVAVALAMGAGRVVAPGRNRAVLGLLADRFGPRLRPVPLTGDEAGDRAAMSAAADGPIDMVIDLLPPSAPSSAARTAAMTVREYGRVVLMGGVGMLGGDDLSLPYPWIMRNSITVRGQWMYPRTANVGIIRLLASAPWTSPPNGSGRSASTPSTTPLRTPPAIVARSTALPSRHRLADKTD